MSMRTHIPHHTCRLTKLAFSLSLSLSPSLTRSLALSLARALSISLSGVRERDLSLSLAHTPLYLCPSLSLSRSVSLARAHLRALSCTIARFLSVSSCRSPDTFLITSLDEYGNDRDQGRDLYHVRAVPCPIWDTMEPYSAPRLSQDCMACRDTLRGGVLDHGDGLYTAEVVGYKRGNYKVLAELALTGGVFATYYSIDAAENVGPSLFHRGANGQISGAGGAQVLDTVLDLATPCVYRKNWPGVPEGTYQCSKWIQGRALGGHLNQVFLDRRSWSHGVRFSAWSDWTILFTEGACKGQHRKLGSYSSAAHGGTATLSSPLSEIPGTIVDAFDSAKSHGYTGCFGPDATSQYILFSSAGAPGSISASVFAVEFL